MCNQNFDLFLMLGAAVWPVCLPGPREKFDPGYICVTCGWGRLRESKELMIYI